MYFTVIVAFCTISAIHLLPHVWEITPDRNTSVAQLVGRFSAIYGTRSPIAFFGRPCHWVLVWTIFIRSTPSCRIYLYQFNIFLLTFLFLPTELFPSRLAIKILHSLLISPIHACSIPTFFSLLDFISRVPWVQFMKFSLRLFLQYPVTSFV